MNENWRKMGRDRESVVFKGKIGEIVHIEHGERIFEMFRRPPGTRLVIVSSDNKILITKEYRHETNSTDLRLPGGKVCDTLEEYDDLRASESGIHNAAVTGAIKEAQEEVGLDIYNPELITVAGAGATVEWDLYYFLVRDFQARSTGQQLEQDEDIEITWMKPAEIRRAISNGHMQEWRSVGVLLGNVLPRLEAEQVRKD